MLILLPTFTVLILSGILLLKKVADGYRSALLLSAVSLGAGAVLFTEIASLFFVLTPAAVGWFWALLFLFAGAFFLGYWISGLRLPFISVASLKGHVWEIVFFAAAVIMAIVTFWIGSISAPNNWDSMTYHLPRVMHWLQNHSLAYYATNIDRQNVYLPGAEILVLHAWALGGGDRWVHGVQWFSFIGCVVGASLIARWLGAGIGGQIFSSLFAITLPTAILQSMTTQNDLVVSFWIMSGAFFILELTQRWSWGRFLGAAGAFALAAVTKGTAFLLLPFLALGMIHLIRSGRKVRAGVLLIGCLLLMALVVGGHAYREITANKGGVSKDTKGLIMERRDPAAILSNVFRNLSSALRAPSVVWNKEKETLLEQIHGVLKISSRDPKTTSGGSSPYDTKLAFHEDYAGYPLHVLWLIMFLGGMIFFIRQKGRAGYLVAWTGAVFLFVLMIKWQPWGTRFHVPLLLLAAPLAGVFAEKARRLSVFFAVCVCVYGACVVVFNVRHPFLGKINVFSERSRQFFAESTHLEKPYLLAAEVLRKSGCRYAGLITGGDDWEYPLWALTRKEKIIFRHLDRSGRREGALVPCAIIDTGSAPGDKVRVWSGVPFVRVFGSPDMAMYLMSLPQGTQ